MTREVEGSNGISIHASEKEATEALNIERDKKVISIHASEKEATLFLHTLFLFWCISIHASEKEATWLGCCRNIPIIFQSTPPRRRRLGEKPSFFGILDFNPRLREGGDL